MPLQYGSISCASVTLDHVKTDMGYGGTDPNTFKAACQFASGERTCLPNPEVMRKVAAVDAKALADGQTLCSDWSSYTNDGQTVDLTTEVVSCADLNTGTLGLENPTALEALSYFHADNKCQWYGFVLNQTCYAESPTGNCKEADTCAQINEGTDLRQIVGHMIPVTDSHGCFLNSNQEVEAIPKDDCAKAGVASSIGRSFLSIHKLNDKCKRAGDNCELNPVLFESGVFKPSNHGTDDLCKTAAFTSYDSATCQELKADNCLVRGLVMGDSVTGANTLLCKKKDGEEACESMVETSKFSLSADLVEPTSSVTSPENVHPLAYENGDDLSNFSTTKSLCERLSENFNVSVISDECVVGSGGVIVDPATACTNTPVSSTIVAQQTQCASVTGLADGKECRVAKDTSNGYKCEVADDEIYGASSVKVSQSSAKLDCSMMGLWYGKDDKPMANAWIADAAGATCTYADTCDKVTWTTGDTTDFITGNDLCTSIGHIGGEDASVGVVCEFVTGEQACSSALSMVVSVVMATIMTMLY